MRKSCAPMLALMLAVPGAGRAETLGVDQVVALSQAGLGDEAVIAKIRASGSRFDLSADQMMALKKRGVSGPVIAAMLSSAPAAAAPGATATSMDSPDPAVAHPTGVYMLQAAPAPHMVRMNATVSNQSKTGGIIGYALTGGIASASVKASIQNETSRVHAATGQPDFYFFFDEANADGRLTSTWTQGDGATIQSPSEFTLVRLTKKDGRREARVGSFNIGGAKAGVMDKDRLGYDYQLVRPGVYKVTVVKPLPPGEYGFIYALRAGAGATGAAGARVFDFTVDGA
ncbi:hypothetical protein [Sphingomonas sp.]|uniref:hypothetical protein n=1 Tax=Sphingomonas sp. TaxID=28214 RepID=UPI003B00B582